MSVAALGPLEPCAPWTWEERHPLASELEWCPASPDLALRMAELDPLEVDEEAIVEGIAAWERLAAWAAEGQARWVNELAGRARTGAEVDRLPDEVATRLAITRRAAEAKVELAAGLLQHPRLAVGMKEGWLSERKAASLLHDVEHLPRRLADAVLDRVLDRAGERTGPQLRADVRAAELALDAEAAATRHERARRDRCVRLVPAPDAMAWIHALLPAPDAATVMTALEAAATHGPGDDRTADQRRADALASMARRVLDSGLGPEGRPLEERQHRRPHLLISVAPVRSSERPSPDRSPTPFGPVAHLAGYGLVPTSAIAHLLPGAETREVPVDEDGALRVAQPGTDGYRPSAELARQVVERDRTCRFPGCRVPAERCDIDHVVPFDPRRPARWQTVERNLQALCRHHHRIKTHAGWYVSRDPVSGATLWRSPTGRVHIVGLDPVVPVEPP